VAGYNPMKKEGAIILGIGGDNSNGSAGTFYEGVMTSGYPTDATENAVQANIVAAGYTTAARPSGTPAAGTSISLRATTACCTGRYIRHQNDQAVTSVITSSSSSLDKNDATWIVRSGLAYSSCVSFESKNYPGSYLRHRNYQLYRNANDGSALFANDATFCPQPGMNGQGLSWASFNFPNRLLRHYNNIVYIGSEGGSNTFDSATSWADDVSWVVASPWA
ncbi:AbfB domain-containing protein, partial [Nonomuraea sp. NPDC051941]|uniref:AbfB domain-containing protein n=1 Tax=Nonomuraea sp. NPDC051941 TaxID=3364373 RepID=UPI0037CC775A